MARNTSGLKRGGPGRPKGVPNKATLALKPYAQRYSAEAIDGLVAIMRTATDPRARVAAIRELLDRGYGRPLQAVAGADGEGPVELVIRWRDN